MGLMELSRIQPGQLIVTPHPMLLDGQRTVVWELQPGDSLYSILMRNVPELDGQPWAVSIGGMPVERHLWHHVFPKQGQVIEVRGGVGKAALATVALMALGWWAAAAMAALGTAGGTVFGLSGVAGYAAVGAVYIGGSMLINKVMMPKPPKASSQQQDSVYSLSGARNQLRPYEPLPMLFGKVRITPDMLSKPYTWYEGNDQYLGMQLCAGINVGRIEDIYNGDTLLSSYEGAKVYHAGYSQMPDQAIPLYSNADVIEGGQLLDTSSDPKHTPSAWIERTSSTDTVRLIVGLEYQLYDKTSKGKDKNNSERVEVQYRPAGTTNWLLFGSYTLNSSKTKAYRAGFGKDVERGQYDVRVRTAGLNTDGSGAQAAFTWSTLTSVQVDEADYTGLSRTGIELKATGQLNGSPDELRGLGHADPIPVWDGSAWNTVETSNPGAQILAYARGITRAGRLLGGMALDEEQIDVESLKAFTLHCAANGYAYDYYVKDARNHEQVLSAIALAGFGQITWAGGRLGVVWAAQDQPLSGVVNMGTIKKGQFQVDYSLSNAADGIEYTYIDGVTWETKTLRVPAPGVTTMLNPAQVTGEGVTTEEHAARMARWHLAQSLYQYKDISYSTDIEHLSYQRLSVLAMQHDMTQWGYGGRVAAAADNAGTVTLRLDEAVPSPPSGVGYIGLRIPGERVYRVLKVKPFIGESDTIELLDPWPDDAALPGGALNDPAHDTLWIYDFKQTPGLRVRVVRVEPEADLKGASVRVVQEGAEFWNYVLTGEYVPSPGGSLLHTRPVASNLKITEQQVVQGDTVFTELTATFDVSGPVGNVVVSSAAEGQELEQVAQTQTRTATWRIPQAGVYDIVVRPYSPEGQAGIAASVQYATEGADAPPVLVDLFDVEQRSGGVRLYTWGWLSETIQSADFAGVEIRYIADSVAAPIWDEMTPVGETGYHTAPFEAVVPTSGTWTFACRSRNTAGLLSVGMNVITRTLAANLGEQLGGIGGDIEAITQQQAAQQQLLDQEILDRVQGDLTEATARANAILAEQTARATAITSAVSAAAQQSADDLLNAKLELEAAIETETTIRQSDVESLANQMATISAGTGEQFDTGGGIWYFDTTVDGWSGSVTPTAVAGWLRTGVGAGPTPYLQSPTLTVDSNTYRYIKTRIRKAGAVGAWVGNVQWITAADATWDTAKQVTVAEPAWDANNIATLDMRDIPWASGVTRIRLFLFAGPITSAIYWEHDWIAIGRPSPGASAAALQEERTARITGDAAEATQRTTLASQMRGDYTGTNVAQVTSGLVFSERQARTTADAAIASDVSALQVRMPAGNGALATADSVSAVQTAVTNVDGRVTSTVDSIEQLKSALGEIVTVQNPSFETITGNIGWGTDGIGANNTLPASTAFAGNDGYASHGKYAIRFDGDSGYPNRTLYNAQLFDLRNAKRVRLGLNSRTAGTAPPSGVQIRIGIRCYDKDGAYLSNNYAPWVTSEGAGWNYGAKLIDAWWAVPTAAMFGRVVIYVQGLTSGSVIVDSVVCDIESSAESATADALQSLNTTVSSQGGTITSQGNAITALTNDVAGKASTSALNALQTTVTQQGDSITAQATQVAQVKSTAEGAAASVTTLSETFVSSSPVVVVNPSFETDTGWSAATSGAGALPAEAVYTDVVGSGGARTGARVLRINGNTTLYNQGRTNVRTGEKLRLGMYMRNIGTTPNSGVARRLGFRGYDAAGAYVAGSALWTVNNSNATTASWPTDPQSGIYTVPAGVVSVGVMIQIAALTSGSLAIDDIVAERISTTDQTFMARNTVTLDVNGNISGTINENDGERSSFSVLASVFRVLTGGAASGMEWQANYLRVYGSGYQYVIGTGFGASSNLVQWVGANIGVAACTTANCSQAVTTAGVTIVRGSTSAGRMEITPTAINVYDTVNALPRIELGL